MHRHGYKGRKLGRRKDARRALMKGLATDLFRHTSLKTTLPKAKEVIPYAERLITKAKRGGLHNRRLVIARTADKTTAHLLLDTIAPQLKGRDSGHLRLVKLERRRGDNAQLAKVAFVDKISLEPGESEPTKAKAGRTGQTPAKAGRAPAGKQGSGKEGAES
ncbi:50S ribosomal protein L17 [Candidatus Saccharibacteria bacterium]|nr:50S ribosomal protein L17 [Candidatus Saccharibacteria bacterium]